MSKIRYVLKKELKETFRDKKSLAMMLVIPIMIPIILIFMSYIFDTTVDKDVNSYNKIGFSYSLSSAEKEMTKSMNIDIIDGNSEELDKKLDNGEIYAYITKDGNKYKIVSNQSENSTYANALANSYLESYKNYLASNYLVEHEINPNDVINVIEINSEVKESENFMSKYIISYAFLFIIMAITVSATYPATDATAGEKERGTLETLLTFPIKSKDIIIGKYLSVSLSSIITGVLSLALTDVTLMFLPTMFKTYENMELGFNTNMILLSILIIVAFSMFISGLTIAIASKSKTFKEAQSSLTPLNFISFFPGMIAYFANVSSSTVLAMIPFLNYSLIFTDVANNKVNVLQISIMLISTIVLTSIILYVIIKQYKSEKVLFSNK